MVLHTSRRLSNAPASVIHPCRLVAAGLPVDPAGRMNSNTMAIAWRNTEGDGGTDGTC